MRRELKWFAGIYFCFFATLSIFQPYMTLWMDDLGYGVFWIGLFSALIRVLNIFSPVLWAGWVSDKQFQFKWAMFGFLFCFLIWVLFTWVNKWDHPGIMMLFLFLFCSIYWGLGPQMDGLALPWVKENKISYGELRLWGSIGFALVSFLAGYIMNQWSPQWLPWMMAFFMLGAMGCAWKFRSRESSNAHSIVNQFGFKNQWAFIVSCKNHATIKWIFSVMFLVNIGFAAYFIFFVMVLKNHGYSAWLIGFLYAFATICEILAFKNVKWFFSRWSLEKLVLIALVLTVGRWLLIAYIPGSLGAMLLAQSTHAFGFALLHSCSMKLIDRHIKSSHHVLGMGVLNSLTFGVASAIGALIFSGLWDMGGYQYAFLGAALVTLLAFVITLFKKDDRLVFSQDSEYFVNQAYQSEDVEDKDSATMKS